MKKLFKFAIVSMILMNANVFGMKPIMQYCYNSYALSVNVAVALLEHGQTTQSGYDGLIRTAVHNFETCHSMAIQIEGE